MCLVHLPTLSSDRKAPQQARMDLRTIYHPQQCPCGQVSCRCPLLLAPRQRKVEPVTHRATIMQPPLKSGPILQQLQVVYLQGLPLVGPQYLQNLRLSIRKLRSPDLCQRHSGCVGTRVEPCRAPQLGALRNQAVVLRAEGEMILWLEVRGRNIRQLLRWDWSTRPRWELCLSLI